MPSADTDKATGGDGGPITARGDDRVEVAGADEARQALLEAVAAELGDALVETDLIPGQDLWLRVTNEAWGHAADYLRNRQRFRFFDWLSAIDWMPSPYGRSHDAAVDKEPGQAPGSDGEAGDGEPEEDEAPTGAGSRAGGSTRFQVIARVYSLTTLLGVTVKADLGPDLSVATWTDQYPGASWHEREAHEMFGITFAGHPDLRNLYLPSDFEGHPLRKDFPLLARLVKPWPGLVDVEPMPEPTARPATSNPEAAGAGRAGAGPDDPEAATPEDGP